MMTVASPPLMLVSALLPHLPIMSSYATAFWLLLVNVARIYTLKTGEKARKLSHQQLCVSETQWVL